jgi:hypothetical protein
MIFLALSASTAQARIYLWGSGRSNGGTAELDRILNPAGVLKEPVIINGVRAELRVGIIGETLNDCLRILKAAFPAAECAMGFGNVKVTIKDSSYQTRILLINTGLGNPLVQFSIRIPRQIPREFTWPTDLPRCSDAIPLQYIRYPDRKSIYGAFSTALSGSGAFREIDATMRASGWSPATRGGSNDTGGIFINEKTLEIMIVNFHNGQGSIYRKPLDTK